jgi:hypothetical protein
MDFNKRNRDLTEVFDAKWKANHNDDVKKLKERDRIRNNKLFSSNPSEYEKKDDFNFPNNNIKSSREIQLERLDRNMSNLRNMRGKNF